MARRRHDAGADLVPASVPPDLSFSPQEVATAWHEAAHATAAMSASWGVNFVRLHPAGSPTPGDCNWGEPPMPDYGATAAARVLWCRSGGAIACAGPIAECAVWDSLDNLFDDDTEAFSEDDRTVFRRFQEASPERAIAF